MWGGVKRIKANKTSLRCPNFIGIIINLRLLESALYLRAYRGWISGKYRDQGITVQFSSAGERQFGGRPDLFGNLIIGQMVSAKCF